MGKQIQKREHQRTTILPAQQTEIFYNATGEPLTHSCTMKTYIAVALCLIALGAQAAPSKRPPNVKRQSKTLAREVDGLTKALENKAKKHGFNFALSALMNQAVSLAGAGLKNAQSGAANTRAGDSLEEAAGKTVNDNIAGIFSFLSDAVGKIENKEVGKSLGEIVGKVESAVAGQTLVDGDATAEDVATNVVAKGQTFVAKETMSLAKENNLVGKAIKAVRKAKKEIE